MKTNRLFAASALFIAAALFSISPRIHAAGAGTPKTSVDANTAFSRLKGLVGEWDVDSTQGKGHSRFEIIANNSVVLEHFTAPGAQEMLTAYHLDGNQLVLTHYCMAGNQPRMVADKFDAATGELNFAFIGGSNIAPGAGHMHDAVYHLTASDHFEAKWDFFEAGKVKFSEEMTYTRVR